ncbi:MAG: RNA polymerase sigma-54 factor [Calditrichaeota bacterium]|nr:RNA polymerase sigma-54 factor [Calditrichota bacterium]
MQMHQVIGLRQKLEMQAQPQQILRSELIQTPLLLLEARFQQEFEQNPLLEVADELEMKETAEDDDPYESSVIKEALEESEDRSAREAEAEEREPDWEKFFDDQEDVREEDRRFYKSNQAITEPVEIPQADLQSLTESLHEQLRMEPFTEVQMEIGEYIIGSLDARGFLDTPVDLIAGLAGATTDEVELVLERIQRFDPPGIAARSLQECLLIQLEVQGRQDTLAWTILEEFFDEFTNRRFETIASALDISPQDVQQAFRDITSLNPYPGEGVIDQKLNYIIPDLIVEVIHREQDEDPEFAVILNDGNIPSFYVNEELKKLILKRNSDKDARDFAIRKAESARWFINAIMQRRTTMLRTMRAIVERQKKWFQSGRDADLRPMILQDIAEDIGMDISTISRVSRDKYVQTPYGVRELKFFFTDRMPSAGGEDVSTRAIKEKLREIIDAEDRKKPLSDQAIADRLKEEGYAIARRTVQKYREQLGIPVKRLRREV